MNLLTIITSIIIVGVIGVVIYFIIKNKSKSPPPVVDPNIPVLLQINVVRIENQI
jgi:heme/copper-type cytochrome/quinol oxidase subunit 2